jgi:sugar lactone lactonase YvrE
VSSNGAASVQRFDLTTGAWLGAFVAAGSGGLTSPDGMAFGPDGNLYVSSLFTHQVLRYDGRTGAFLGPLVTGFPLFFPTYLAFTPDAACAEDATRLCLGGGRFRIEVAWRTPDGGAGPGHAVRLTGDSGFWFFGADNVELLVKVLDACSFNSRHWVFAGGLTNVATTLTVTDTQTGTVKTYQNPQGTPFAPIQDTAAFSSCP